MYGEGINNYFGKKLNPLKLPLPLYALEHKGHNLPYLQIVLKTTPQREQTLSYIPFPLTFFISKRGELNPICVSGKEEVKTTLSLVHPLALEIYLLISQ